LNIFLSYASAQRPLAEDLCHRLQAAGHEVFFDREDLPPGRSYDDHIFQAIAGCELFVVLVTPDSVADGRYTRTELKIAARRWPTPDWHVLPVLAAPTPLDTVPPYLRALNLLQPEGNLAAEVLLEVQARVRADAQAHASASGGAPGSAPGPPPPTAATSPAPAPAPPRDPAATGDAAPHYRDLRLRFGRDADGRYRVQLDPAPAGAAPTGADGGPSALLSIDAAAIERRLWQGAVAIEGPARRGALPGAAPALLPGALGARDTGTALHGLLFGSTLGTALREGLRAVDPQRGAGLRLVLDTTDAPELARLPWELLYSPQDEDYVFSDRFKPLVRRLALDVAPPVLAVTPPLRLLVVIATPSDRPELQVGDELAHLDDALAPLAADGRLQTERLAHATLERLDDALLRWRPHVLHFIGHGDFDGDEGRLLLEGELPPGAAAPITGRRLAVLLRNHLGALRLVFLNSCLGAAAAPRAAFGGVAQSLVRRGLPAVVAMQFPVPDAQAVGLARHFYRYVAAGQPVDAALTSARAFMVARGDEVCWAAPVLYLNAEDGRLFDIAPPVAGVVPSPLPLPLPLPLPPPVAAAASGEAPASIAARAPSSAAPAQRRGLPAVWWLAALLVAAAAGWFAVGQLSGPEPTAGEVPAVEAPVDDQAPATTPPPPPPPPPPAPAVELPIGAILSPLTRPDARRAIESAQAALRAGDAAAAARSLAQLRARDPLALSARRLGGAHAALVDELLGAAEAAQARGEPAVARSLVATLQAMRPADPAQQARLAALPAPPRDASVVRGLRVRRLLDDSAGPHGGLTVTVRRGDTLWRLAERFLGDGRRWPALAGAHDALAGAAGVPAIGDPDRLAVGQRLLLPPDPVTGQARADYHVSRGESLSLIARRLYGDAAQWRHLQQVNRLPDPDRLVPGQVLTITPLR
jgi:nucleoid-associated protein YgaU